MRKSENIFFIRFSTVRIFHVNMATSEGAGKGKVEVSLLILGMEKSMKYFRFHSFQQEACILFSAQPIKRTQGN